jgi:hypothetical protein
MSAAHLIGRLDGVMGSHPTWRAICPAHESRHRSRTLAIRELDDGRVLLRCHAECDTGDVLAAVGMTYGDLYPDRTSHHAAPLHRPHPARDVLAALAHECIIVGCAAQDLQRGIALSDDDRDRLATAIRRIRAAAEVAA